MAIISITASPTGNGQTSSGFPGSNVNLWSAGSGNVQVNLPPGQGSAWVVWQVQVAGLTPGEPVNGVRVVGTNDFTVGGGGGGIVRTAQAYADIEHTFAAFLNANPTGIGITIPGTGVGQPVDNVVERPGFTSTDLINGTFYFGIVANSTAADAGLGDAVFRTSALNWTIYTGADVPNPAPGEPVGTVDNPAGNTNGNVRAGGAFASVTYTQVEPRPISFLGCTFTLSAPAGVTFAANGAQSYTPPAGGALGTGLYTQESGAINVAANVTPGTYTLRLGVTGQSPNFSTNYAAQLVVGSSGSGWFFEI